MVINVSLPSFGVAILDAKIVNWLREEGEEVKKDEPIVEVETDKVTFEVVSPINGFLIKKLYKVGDLVKVDEPLAIVNAKREEITNQDLCYTSLEEQDKEVEKVELREKKISKKSTPAAKNLAKQNNIDLEKINGAGPNGRVTKDDILKYLEQLPRKEEKEEVIPFVGTRKKIADTLSESKNSKVQVTTTIAIDVTNTEIIRDMVKSELKENHGIRLTLLSFVIKATIDAIKKFPILNSSLHQDKIIVKKYINFGIAVESSKNLIVPVIHHSEEMSFWRLIKEIDVLIKRARKGILTPEYIGGGTITISNAGSFGSILSTPIIYGNQSAILWMGKVTKHPVVNDNDQIKIRKIMNLCISYDHRIVDGSQVAQFLKEISSRLENPGGLLINELIKEKLQ